MNIEDLYAVIKSRADADPAGSYTSKLLASGIPQIAQKVGEEATEVVVASLAQTNERLVSETADLLYHLLVLLYARQIILEDIWNELEKRNKK